MEQKNNKELLELIEKSSKNMNRLREKYKNHKWKKEEIIGYD